MIKRHTTCEIGEHVFLPKQTESLARHIIVQAVFCQHCLLIVTNGEWEQMEYERMNAEHNEWQTQIMQAAEKGKDLPILGSSSTPANSAFANISGYTGKKRGRKPKAQNED